MKKIALCIACILFTASCWAGPYGDDLKKCLVESTSKRDNIVLVRWLSKALLAHPEVKDLAVIPNAKAMQIDKDFARYVERLLGENCSAMAVVVDGAVHRMVAPKRSCMKRWTWPHRMRSTWEWRATTEASRCPSRQE